MGYPEQFQMFREARGLTREQLAMRADCHRNTVINVESGRPVKFATIMLLMEHMGFRKDSDETRLLALMWLESITGIEIGPVDAARLPTRRAAIGDESRPELTFSRLGSDEVELLAYAARNRKVMSALRTIRDLARDGVRPGASR